MTNLKPLTTLIVLSALALASSGCVDNVDGDAVTDPTGGSLGKTGWTTISFAESHLNFVGPTDNIVSVGANELPGRRQERIILRNGAIFAEYMYGYQTISPAHYSRRASEEWADQMFNLMV